MLRGLGFSPNPHVLGVLCDPARFRDLAGATHRGRPTNYAIAVRLVETNVHWQMGQSRGNVFPNPKFPVRNRISDQSLRGQILYANEQGILQPIRGLEMVQTCYFGY